MKQRYELQKVIQNDTMIIKDNSINNDQVYHSQSPVKLQNANLASLNLEEQINDDIMK